MKQKRCLSIQDISCTGRCSLTVALPIISCAGIETAIIPTAVLSTHTGGFSDYTFKDLTDQIEPIGNHWRSLKRDFAAIYTGYLAPKQVDLVKDLIGNFAKPDTLVLVDPAMADKGELYPGFDPAFVKRMKGLVALADITVPNLTEACFLLDRDYNPDYDENSIKELLTGLTALGPQMAIISGISFAKGQIGVYFYDKKTAEFGSFFTADVPGYYHGAGDIFASGLLSGLLNGLPLKKACILAHDLVHQSIIETNKDGEKDMRFGLHFEKALPFFIDELKALTEGKQEQTRFNAQN